MQIHFDNFPVLDTFSRMVHNEPMKLQEWLSTLPGSPTVSQAADHSGISKATLLRHAKSGKTTAEFIIGISRAYEVNEVDSLLALGFISRSAIDEYGVEAALEGATNQQLLDEIMRRSDPEARYLFGNEGGDDVIGLDPSVAPIASLDDARSNNDESDVHSLPYAADSSDTEPEPGDDDYHDGP